ncbi:AAA family ATPase [Candidatus Poriferisodalis sp.]|uniref:AAA family ATPase n=1 Tax=Candidatus Poriferisodalis sp. TaxID=3101277 RepID=UPI003B528F76
MRFESAHIKNFKLLENVDLTFSTDSQQPLTVIRAENGSGKTSILYALRWAMYGAPGIPTGMRLTAAVKPPGRPVTVQVRAEFTTTDPYSGDEVRYRLIRSCEETPGEDDRFQRNPDQLRLLRRTSAGEEDIEDGKEGLIRKLLPLNLADVFFTNGDDVQRFISSGQQADRERQKAVHSAIRQLLGLDDVEATEKHLSNVAKSLKQELADDGGEELQAANAALEEIQERVAEDESELDKIRERISRVDEQIRADERELDGIRGIGDLDTIQARIRELEGDLLQLRTQEDGIRGQMKELLQSEGLSWRLIGPQLQQGLGILDDLADRKVIPGAAIEVLTDRLELGICICGEDLGEGSERHQHIEDLIERQRVVAPELQRLSTVWHLARNSSSVQLAAIAAGRSFDDIAAELRQQYTGCRDAQRRKQADLDSEREKRKQIDAERVRTLTERINQNTGKRSSFDRKYGEVEGRLQGLEEEARLADERVRRAEAESTLNETIRLRSVVADDLLKLARGTLGSLKSDYVQRVSARMNELFLDIVGSDPDAESAVFTRVTINDRFDIVIHTQGGKTLDADYELNGASQRALTLSFIWALMEVAGREAPRIIDTPLGMTSGAVKHRMVELLTSPADAAGLPYQVVLLMTRSEIRDIEDLLDERAGSVSTLSCSKDYPVDLVNEWGDGVPAVRSCACDHRQICFVCTRRKDDSTRFTVREEVTP